MTEQHPRQVSKKFFGMNIVNYILNSKEKGEIESIVKGFLSIVKKKYNHSTLSLVIEQLENKNLDLNGYKMIFITLLAKEKFVQSIAKKGLYVKSLRLQLEPFRGNQKLEELITLFSFFCNEYIFELVNQTQVIHKIKEQSSI